MIEIETRIVEVKRDLAQKILGEALPTPERIVVPLPGEEARLLLGLGEGHMKTISAPRLSVLDGQKANVSVLKQTTYVKEFTVEEESGRKVASPVVETIQDGVVVDVQATVNEDTSKIRIEGVVRA